MAQFLSDGFDIHFTDTVPGPVNTLLLIHGFSSNSHENWGRTGWVHAAQHKGLRCVTLDLRGHGKSAKPHDPAAYDRAPPRLGEHTDEVLRDWLGMDEPALAAL